MKARRTRQLFALHFCHRTGAGLDQPRHTFRRPQRFNFCNGLIKNRLLSKQLFRGPIFEILRGLLDPVCLLILPGPTSIAACFRYSRSSLTTARSKTYSSTSTVLEQLVKTAGAGVTLGVIVIGGISIVSPRVHADDNDENDQQSKIKIGFQIAPVKLNLAGKDRSLVGLGSYIVNAENDCNACHSNGNAPPNFEFVSGGNPYLGQRPTVFDSSTYLAGGHDFGPVGPPPTPDIISRNLTPDKTGRPEGGNTFEEFRQIMRNGKDLDHLHLSAKCESRANSLTTYPANFCPLW